MSLSRVVDRGKGAKADCGGDAVQVAVVQWLANVRIAPSSCPKKERGCPSVDDEQQAPLQPMSTALPAEANRKSTKL